MGLRHIAREAVKRTGYVIDRWPINRFEGMDDALALLARRDYRPRFVIDAGANRGQWFATASPVFAAAAVHLLEPHDECRPDLDRARRGSPLTVDVAAE